MFRKYQVCGFLLRVGFTLSVTPAAFVSADETVLRIATASEIRNYVKNEEEKGVDESVAVPSVVSREQISALDALNKDSKPLLIPTEVSFNI